MNWNQPNIAIYAAFLLLTACGKGAPEQSPVPDKTTGETAPPTPEPAAEPVADDTPNTPAGLEQTAWELKGKLEGTRTDVSFQQGRLSGHGGVNRFMGQYALDGSSLKIDKVAASRKAGPPEHMQQEQAFLDKLSRTDQFRITANELILLAANGQVLLTLTPLKRIAITEVEWLALGVNNGKGGVVSMVAETTVSARFDKDGKVSGSSGCNDYSGSYNMERNLLRFGPVAGTRKMCAAKDIMEQEGNYLGALGNTANFRIDDDILELRSDKGSLQVRFKAIR